MPTQRADVLLQAMQLRGAGDRNDPRLLGKQLGKRNLRRRHSLSSCNLADEINESLVCLSRLRREAGNDVAEIGFVECCVLADGARKEALAQRAKGNETDPELLKRGQDLLLGLPPPQRIFALEGGNRLNRVSTTNRLHACFRQSEVLDLAFPG